MYVHILCDLTRIRICTLLAHCCIYGVGLLCCLELFHKYFFITNIRGELKVLVISWYLKYQRLNINGYIVNGMRRTPLSYKDNYIPLYVKNTASSYQWIFSVTWRIGFPFIPWTYRLHPPFYTLYSFQFSHAFQSNPSSHKLIKLASNYRTYCYSTTIFLIPFVILLVNLTHS